MYKEIIFVNEKWVKCFVILLYLKSLESKKWIYKFVRMDVVIAFWIKLSLVQSTVRVQIYLNS